MTAAEKEIRAFQRDIKRLEKEPESEGRNLLISFYNTQIKLWSE